jgi:hypothetical protein
MKELGINVTTTKQCLRAAGMRIQANIPLPLRNAMFANKKWLSLNSTRTRNAKIGKTTPQK